MLSCLYFPAHPDKNEKTAAEGKPVHPCVHQLALGGGFVKYGSLAIRS
jgi:hypothetical protein